ncbi:MAG: aminoglycoside phosphotransferase family protein [Actinomycetota bacterium]|nr:aminoglycoside phosphotransferase family protein [Actinomycetota bacterium]
MRHDVTIPPGLAAQAQLGPDWVDWFDRLPTIASDVLDEWQLTLDGAAMHGFASLVLPVRTETDIPAALKLTFDEDDESLHEGLALQRWAGRGTVKLLRADPNRRALLLERLHTQDLNGVDDLEACEIVARFYPRIHVAALPQLRTVTSYVDEWLTALATVSPGGPLPRRMVKQALSLGRDLVEDPDSTGRITHGDLHYENVLAADREPWLVIDPKPMSGDPHYEPAPMLWNRWGELVASGDIRCGLRRRFQTLIDAAGLDEDRARDWVVVRSIINAHWSIEEAERARRDLDADEHAWITLCVTTAKAVQD